MANHVNAQSYSNDFENGYTWYPPWFNLNIVADSTDGTMNHVCLCDTLHEYGLGFAIEAEKHYPNQNINCKYACRVTRGHAPLLLTADSTFATGGHDPLSLPAASKAKIVISIDDDSGNRYWCAYPLQNYINNTAEWSQVSLDLNFPADYFNESSKLKAFIWNEGRERLVFDEARLEVMPWEYSFLPKIDSLVQKDYDPENYCVLREDPYDDESAPITYPIGMFEEYIIDGDTLQEFNLFQGHPNYAWARSRIGSTLMRMTGHRAAPLPTHGKRIGLECILSESCEVLRRTLVIPFIDSTLTVYRRNHHIDSTEFQSEYYLDREGFTIGEGPRSFTLYHPSKVSSMQLDATHRIAYINLDYWRDHPLIHYPFCDTIEDYFEDVSCDYYYRPKPSETRLGEIYVARHYFHYFTVHIGDSIHDLPRLMPVWDGYQSAFIFTEHADWTDLHTHRAVLFGNENITKPEEAVGGFCYYDIPVTKSVFYWNPDHITNAETSKGLFTGEVATLKTNRGFFKLLKSLKKEGFEICLHSPEVYTTLPSEFPKAMRFMKRQFNTVSWIDHGYNNGPEKNREDLVCDGLLPESPQYAAALWRKNAVRYLWNAYYEENRMEQFNFDSHFVQPYDGFGDALPNRQITTLPNGDKDFLLWSTPSTLEVNEDKDWYYFFDSTRLQKLVDHHNVFITHVYPAWSDPYRGFWQYDEDSTAVAMPGFNFALSQLARFREEKKILPTTIEKYLSYYENLLKVDYQIIDNHTVSLINHGENIEGLTLLCTKPIIVEGKPIDFRKVDEGYLVWFDLKKNETVIINIRE